MKKKFSEISVGVEFVTKDGVFKKEGRTTALCIVSTNFPQQRSENAHPIRPIPRTAPSAVFFEANANCPVSGEAD